MADTEIRRRGLPGAEVEIPPLDAAVQELERSLIAQALAKCGGVQTQAARLLGTTRRILRYKMNKLGLGEAAPRAARPGRGQPAREARA